MSLCIHFCCPLVIRTCQPSSPLARINLFFLSRDARKAAQAHCNKHLIKMTLETAQLLCTAHRLLDGSRAAGVSASGRKQTTWVMPDESRERALYRATHANHPVAVWVVPPGQLFTR